MRSELTILGEQYRLEVKTRTDDLDTRMAPLFTGQGTEQGDRWLQPIQREYWRQYREITALLYEQYREGVPLQTFVVSLHSTWDIQISGGDFSGMVNEQFLRHVTFNIADIESVNHVRHKSGYFVTFKCAGNANCIQLGDDRGDGLKFRDVPNANINVGSTAGGGASTEQVNAFGLDLERWAHSVGGKVDANFAN